MDGVFPLSNGELQNHSFRGCTEAGGTCKSSSGAGCDALDGLQRSCAELKEDIQLVLLRSVGSRLLGNGGKKCRITREDQDLRTRTSMGSGSQERETVKVKPSPRGRRGFPVDDV